MKEAVSERFWIQVENHDHDQEIYEILSQYKGKIPVVIRYQKEQQTILASGYSVAKDLALQESLKEIVMKTIYR